jgi:hypothetical protein
MGSEKPTVLEGTVLDQEGNTIYEPRIPRPQGARNEGVRVFRLDYVSAWWPLILGIAIPFLFVSGIFVFTVLITLGILVRLLRNLLKG